MDLLKYAAKNQIHIDLLSDQTSCHAAYEGGYCPLGITFEERTRLLASDRNHFRKLVDQSLHRHFSLIGTLSKRGVFFFDYGNAFLKAVFDAGVKTVAKNGYDPKDGFVFPFYFEAIMGPIFDYGSGPFRWVCLSGKSEDLSKTDRAAMDCIDPNRRPEDRDNWKWIRDAENETMTTKLFHNAKIFTPIVKGVPKAVPTKTTLQYTKMGLCWSKMVSSHMSARFRKCRPRFLPRQSIRKSTVRVDA